jgi:hypothetical protein
MALVTYSRRGRGRQLNRRSVAANLVALDTGTAAAVGPELAQLHADALPPAPRDPAQRTPGAGGRPAPG